jgi:hypothetical protein
VGSPTQNANETLGRPTASEAPREESRVSDESDTEVTRCKDSGNRLSDGSDTRRKDSGIFRTKYTPLLSDGGVQTNKIHAVTPLEKSIPAYAASSF